MSTNRSSVRYEIGHPECVVSCVYNVMLHLVSMLGFMETDLWESLTGGKNYSEHSRHHPIG